MKYFPTSTIGQAISGVGPAMALRRMKSAGAWLCIGLFASGAAISAGPAHAETFPDKSRPLRIIVPSGPGSALDLLARAYGTAINEAAGMTAVVENKPGGDGAIGILSFLNSPSDGYTFLIVSSSWMALNPAMNPNLRYDPLKDLTPITIFSKASLVMSMTGASQFKSVREFVADAKKAPGKYTCAQSSPTLRMACEYLQAAAGIKLLNVPYKTTAAAYVAVGSGEADVIFADAGSSRAHWESGRVKGVAVTSTERIPSLPNIPTTAEEGIPDFLMGAWYGAYYKAGISPQITAAMRDIITKAGETKTVKDALTLFVHEPYHLSGDEAVRMNRAEIERWTKLIRTHNITFTY